ncbi:hypothetical protein THAOC_20605, partial [Thalassiosira oceanica]
MDDTRYEGCSGQWLSSECPWRRLQVDESYVRKVAREIVEIVAYGKKEEEEEPPATAATVVTQSYECPFCAGGMSDPDATLEKVGRPEQTCLEAKRFASVLLKSDDECSRVRQGMAVCCPDELAEDMAEEEEEKKDDEPKPATTTT